MRFIDLHVHSNASDGTLTPSEVVRRAIEKNLAAIALSDHDTIKGVESAINAANGYDLEVIPATELSCYYLDREIHILGFYVDPYNLHFQEELEQLANIRQQRNLDMIAHFVADGIPMSLEKLQAGNPDSILTRAHFARVLIEEGICKNKDEAFRKYIGIGCPYYLPKPKITPEYALSLITEAGGLPFLAHPLLYHLGYHQIESLIQSLKPLGLAGLEVYHSSNNCYESDKLRSLALKYELLVSGGSDFHGKNKPDIDIGCGRGGLRITEPILDRIKAYRNQIH